jgi:hypothetical protein
MTDQTRRDVLMGGAAVAITDAIATVAGTRKASAQKADSIAPSEWDY